MTSRPKTIILQIPATPELLDLVKGLLSNGANISFASGNGSPDEMISLRQAAIEVEYSYDMLRKLIVDENRINFSRPSGAPKGKIFVRRGDLQDLIKSPGDKSAMPGRPRLSTRVSIL